MTHAHPIGAAADISVIVAFKDAAWSIERCMQSLVEQRVDGASVEIIAVDNGSTDDSTARVRAFESVHLLDESRPGAYFARNTALQKASGRILVFTDPDCIAEPGWLGRLTAALSGDAKVALGHTRFTGRSLVLRTLEDYESARDHEIFAGHDGRCYYGRANNLAVEREVFDEVGDFVTAARGGDSVLVRRAVERFGCEVAVYEPAARVEHLEIDTARAYFEKIFTYARSMRRFAHVVDTQVPSRDVRRAIFERSCRDNGYSSSRRALLAALLTLESLVWSAGWRLEGRASAARSDRS